MKTWFTLNHIMIRKLTHKAVLQLAYVNRLRFNVEVSNSQYYTHVCLRC